MFSFEDFYMYFLGSKEVREKLKSSVCWFKRTNTQVGPTTIQLQNQRTASNLVRQQPSVE